MTALTAQPDCEKEKSANEISLALPRFAVIPLHIGCAMQAVKQLARGCKSFFATPHFFSCSVAQHEYCCATVKPKECKCGSAVLESQEYFEPYQAGTIYRVRCNQCKAQTPYYDTEEEAIERWNAMQGEISFIKGYKDFLSGNIVPDATISK